MRNKHNIEDALCIETLADSQMIAYFCVIAEWLNVASQKINTEEINEFGDGANEDMLEDESPSRTPSHVELFLISETEGKSNTIVKALEKYSNPDFFRQRNALNRLASEHYDFANEKWTCD